MQNNEHSFFFAKSINELSYQLKSIKELRVVGGCTALKEDDTKIISLRGIAELSSIGKHERYIDFGAGVTLSEIINLERSKTPAILTEATESIANPSIRNLATIGGNICQGNKTQTLFAPLLALDARLEFRNQAETFPILIRNFQKVPEGFFLA
ncbi:MAG: FAD binding domain-containing protein, partial [Treponema sp.]|nr:FAD binding domain-containing protein [Treponema sp.]